MGHSEENLTNSPSSSRVSVWRPLAEKPRNPASSAVPMDSTTSPAEPSDLATSASVLAGTMSGAAGTVPVGVHGMCRSASRYRSVAARLSVSGPTSMRTPVSMGSVSSRLAAAVTCPTAVAKTSPRTFPEVVGSSGTAG